jgi:hypothetical protein
MNSKTAKLVEEIGEKMLVSDEMKNLTPEEFFEHIRTCKSEAFMIAVFLQKFLYDHDQPQKKPIGFSPDHPADGLLAA